MAITESAPEPSPATAADAADLDRAPQAERVVSDVETLKALSDPLRLRILEAMVSRKDATWSVKELAAELAVPATRLYHHVELLLERDLIRVAAQRVVSGIIESRYRVAALSFRLDHRLLSTEADAGALGAELLHTVFDSARDDVARALHHYLAAHPGASPDAEAGADPERPVLTRGVALLTPARAAEFRTRLLALMAEYDNERDEPGVVPFGFLFALYRAPGATEAADD
jgi:DNA-binding transcriptional ArsR family regulator